MDYGNSSTYPYSYHWILETLPHKERKGRGEPSLRFWGLLQSGAVFRRMAPL